MIILVIYFSFQIYCVLVNYVLFFMNHGVPVEIYRDKERVLLPPPCPADIPILQATMPTYSHDYVLFLACYHNMPSTVDDIGHSP